MPKLNASIDIDFSANKLSLVHFTRFILLRYFTNDTRRKINLLPKPSIPWYTRCHIIIINSKISRCCLVDSSDVTRFRWHETFFDFLVAKINWFQISDDHWKWNQRSFRFKIIKPSYKSAVLDPRHFPEHKLAFIWIATFACLSFWPWYFPITS